MEHDELIAQICIAAGMIMEDAIPNALSVRAPINDRILALEATAKQVSALAVAASALLKRR